MLEKVRSTADIGKAVRNKRKEEGLTLAEAAALCGVGYRFLSNLENGGYGADWQNVTSSLRSWPRSSDRPERLARCVRARWSISSMYT